MTRLNIIADSESSSSCCSTVKMNVTEGNGALKTFRGRAALITLGCAKNQVDSEVMLGVLENNGFEIVTDLAQADVAVVNTCGFLESSVKESIDSILEVSEYKKTGRLRRLLVAGCMVERYKEDLAKNMPEVDGFLAIDDILKVGAAANGDLVNNLDHAARPYFLYDDSMPRHLASASHTAYVKISEGCDRPCTFCIIPKIRGAMRSRSLESVVREVQALGAQGVKEVNLVAQDLTSYGLDTRGPGLTELLKALDKSKAVDWIRLLYAYPIGIDTELLRAITDLERVVEYLDLPLQHSSESLLKVMKRPLGRYAPRRIVDFIRSEAPEVSLRTTFIVGFPGETEADIDDLEAFIGEGHFSSVGIFTYSQEAGTPAGAMEGQIPEDVKKARRERLMLKQQEVSRESLEGYVEHRMEVLVEGEHEETEFLLSGRTRFQAPEVDGTVIINDVAESIGEIRAGMIAEVEISEVAGYDLIGTLVKSA